MALRAVVLAFMLSAAIAPRAAPGAPASAPEAACELDLRAAAPDRVPPCIRAVSLEADICRQIGSAARRHGLPEGFLARLIWQESLFDPGAVSHKGALGIAQFIPDTARRRGLADPMNPADALAKSASYLAELGARFGSLGLAAAAYNAGEGRVERLLAGTSKRMPAETEDYVLVITGRGIADWKEGRAGAVDYGLDPAKPFEAACLELARSREMTRTLAPEVAWAPWGVHLGSHFSRSVARRYFALLRSRYPSLLAAEAPLVVPDRKLSRGTRVRYALRIGRDSRREAYLLCGRLRAIGGFCTVAKN
jgi:soluble lytic murein transglycosylase-like protein